MTPEDRLRWLRETHDVGIPLDLAIAAAPLLPNITAEQLVRVRVRRACSWCDTMNDVTHGAPSWCPSCGHRADVARLDCTCGRPGCRGAVSR